MLCTINLNQAWVLTQIPKGIICILLIDTSQLGRKTLEHLIQFPNFHDWMRRETVVAYLPASLSQEDALYARKLGITVLPQFRVYRNGKLMKAFTGLLEIRDISPLVLGQLYG